MAAHSPATVEELARRVAAIARQPTSPSAPRIVGVDGWSGAGKSALAHELAQHLDAPVVAMDDFVPGWHGLAASVDLLVAWVLAPLAMGRPARWQVWDWVDQAFREERRLPPSAMVIVEGCGAGAARARPYLSCLLWVDTSPGQRRIRLQARADWAAYRPWVEVWAEQERLLRQDDDVAAASDVVVDGDHLAPPGRGPRAA